MLSDYSMGNEYGYRNNDQFALFTNILEEFQAYFSVYIAMQTSGWMVIIKNDRNMSCWF